MREKLEKTTELRIQDVNIFIGKECVYIDIPENYQLIVNGRNYIESRKAGRSIQNNHYSLSRGIRRIK